MRTIDEIEADIQVIGTEWAAALDMRNKAIEKVSLLSYKKDKLRDELVTALHAELDNPAAKEPT